jgi:hypothetical protein
MSFDLFSPIHSTLFAAVVLLRSRTIGGTMSDSVQTLDSRRSVTRREFTLEAALAILAGCVISVAETGCGGTTNQGPSPLTTGDVTGVISANHGHTAMVTAAQITAGGAVTLDIQGSATHDHKVSLSQADLGTLKNRQPVSSTSSTDASHSHTVTFTPA